MLLKIVIAQNQISCEFLVEREHFAQIAQFE